MWARALARSHSHSHSRKSVHLRCADARTVAQLVRPPCSLLASPENCHGNTEQERSRCANRHSCQHYAAIASRHCFRRHAPHGEISVGAEAHRLHSVVRLHLPERDARLSSSPSLNDGCKFDAENLTDKVTLCVAPLGLGPCRHEAWCRRAGHSSFTSWFRHVFSQFCGRSRLCFGGRGPRSRCSG